MEATHGNAQRHQRRRGEGSGLLSLPDFGSPVLPASAVVAHIAVGAAAILGRSIAEAARDALAWVLPRDGERRRDEEVGPRA